MSVLTKARILLVLNKIMVTGEFKAWAQLKLEHLCFIKHEYQPTISVL